MGGFEDASSQPEVEVAHDLAVRLATTQEQLRATSDILKVLTASTTGGTASRDQVFDAVVDNARKLLRAQAAQIYLVEADSFVLARSSGLTPEFVSFVAQHPIAHDRATLVGRVTIDRAVHQIDDVLTDPDYRRTDFQRMGGYRTMMGAPMVVGDQVVGALNVWRTEVAPFDEAEQALLSTFAEQAALAWRHVELFSALESRSAELARKVDQLEALAEVGEAISSSLVADEVLTTIVTHAVELSETDGGSLMEVDETTRLFGVRTAYGTHQTVIDALRAAEIHIDRTWVGRATRNREVLQIHDLDAEPKPLDPHLAVLHASGWRSLVAIPLVRPDRVVGALVVRRKSTGPFSDETCELLSAFASQSAVALTNARLYQQLEQQSVALADASRHKSEFLASMSHELRTPLNAVIGFSEVLLERMFGDLNERQEDYLRDIRDSGRHLLELINEILDLSKVEAGRMELDPAPLPLAPILEHGLAMVRERAGRSGISLTLEVDPSVGSVMADELKLKQVVLNLLTNAVKFTAPGGSVVMNARQHDDAVEVTVRDTVMGIAEADRERIFEAFQRGGRDVRTSTEGTGLGLTLSKRIIELHGGRLWMESEVGVGSTFGFSLPVTMAVAQIPAPPIIVPSIAHDPWRVVVIDDDPLDLE